RASAPSGTSRRPCQSGLDPPSRVCGLGRQPPRRLDPLATIAAQGTAARSGTCQRQPGIGFAGDRWEACLRVLRLARTVLPGYEWQADLAEATASDAHQARP